MVDPKKEYELLMRYLQGGAQKREPASMPDPVDTDEWKPSAPAANTTQSFETIAPAPQRSTPKKFSFHWPKWQPITFKKGMRIAVGALSILLLSLLVWKGYTFYQLSPDTIFNQLYVPFSVTPVNNDAAFKNTIAQYYASGNYIAATLQAKKQKQLSDSEKLLTGLSYMQREDYPKAIKWLEPLSNNFKSACRQQAEFYVALTYLKNEDYDHCIERMEHIVYTPTHLYHDRISKGIISDIKMLKWK